MVEYSLLGFVNCKVPRDVLKAAREERRIARVSTGSEPFFASLPENMWSVMDRKNLPYAARLLYVTIAQFSNDNRKAWPSTITLEKHTGFSGTYVRHLTVMLENTEMLRTVPRANNSNVYTLTDLKPKHFRPLWSIWQDYGKEIGHRPAKLVLAALVWRGNRTTMRTELKSMTGLSWPSVKKALGVLSRNGMMLRSLGGGRGKKIVYKTHRWLWAEKGFYNFD